MGTKLDDRLNEALGAPAARETMVPVIVTLRRGADVAAFAADGLDIAHRFEGISAVSGTIRAADLPRLEADASVQRVEFDGKMEALGG